MKWPYPVNYGKENAFDADVLVLGGGLSGIYAAIHAAKKGAKVVIVDKGPVIRSGSAGAGIDHWLSACTNPCCKISPEEFMVEVVDKKEVYYCMDLGAGITSYITCKESWDALLDAEKGGLEFRDVDDEFAGAEFRDEKTKLMFAYDYENNWCIRLRGGADLKVALYRELKRHGVTICDYVMATCLLTEGGKQGSRVVGATGVAVRTGEFYVFRAKATVLSMNAPNGLWIFNTDLNGGASTMADPNNSGEGTAMAWQAGAEMTLMERSVPLAPGGFIYPMYGTGNAHNTYFPCTIVDDNGKEVPWVDRDGNILQTVSERSRPAFGQKCIVLAFEPDYDVQIPTLIPDLPLRIQNGEFKLPLYADFPSMPPHERRAIWGLMVGNEGKTRVPIYERYNKAGFDPDKDMLQANVLPPDKYIFDAWWGGMTPRQWREMGFVHGGGLVVDWDLKTSLNGLYAAGQQTASGANASTAASTGRYAGRKAAEFALKSEDVIIERKQVEEEKNRIYAPVRLTKGSGWKELRGGIARIIQDYLGEFKSESTLKLGLEWLQSIRESEAANTMARNPHELIRTLECFTRLTVGELIMHASLARKASSFPLFFFRLDYPEVDPQEWNKFVTLRLDNEEIKVGELPLRYYLLPPYAPTYEENYNKHCGL
jgi:succinate dehydrogenase/fumarate reductase flavoprotein subunit